MIPTMKTILSLVCTTALLCAGPAPSSIPLPITCTIDSSFLTPTQYHSITIADKDGIWLSIDGVHPDVQVKWGGMQDTFPPGKTTLTSTHEPVVTKTKDGWTIAFKP